MQWGVTSHLGGVRQLSMYEVVPLVDIDKDRWDAFAGASDEAWLWHRSDLIRTLTSWPGRKDLSFALIEDESNEIFAIFPLHRISNSKFGFSITSLNSLGGPAVKNNLGPERKEELLEKAFEQILALSNIEKSVQFDFVLPPVAPAYRDKGQTANLPKFPTKLLEVSTQTYTIDLSTGKTQVWEGFEKRARNAIRKAENLGVKVRVANQTSDLDVYYELHKDTYHRTGVNPHPIEYFDGIWKYFYSKGLAHILFAEVNGQVVAAETFGVYKKGANYWTGAASEKGLACNANSLIQWYAIQHFIDSGLDFYDVGEAFPEAESGKRKGLDRFKRSFGGKLRPFLHGRVVFNPGINSLIRIWKFLRRKS